MILWDMYTTYPIPIAPQGGLAMNTLVLFRFCSSLQYVSRVLYLVQVKDM